MMLFTWLAIVSGFGYDMVQRGVHGKLHFPAIIHIHAIAFIGWLVLFTTQILLARTNNVALHKKLAYKLRVDPGDAYIGYSRGHR